MWERKWRGGGGSVSLSRPRDKAWPPSQGWSALVHARDRGPLWRATQYIVYNAGLCRNRPTGTEVHAHLPASPTIGHRRTKYVPDASPPDDRRNHKCAGSKYLESTTYLHAHIPTTWTGQQVLTH